MTFRPKRALIAAMIVAAIAVFFWMRSLASWRPINLGKLDNPVRFLSKDGRTGISLIYYGDKNYGYGDHVIDLESGRISSWLDNSMILGFSKTSPELAFLADGETGKLKLREVRTGNLKQTLPWVRGIFAPRFVDTTDKSAVAVVGKGTLFLWDLNSGKHLTRVPLKNPFTTDDQTEGELYALSSDATRLVGCSFDRGTVWNAQSGQVLRSWIIKGNAEFISSNGRVLVYNSSDIDGYLFVDTSTGKVLWHRQRDGSYPWLTDDDEVLFSTDKQCQVFDIFTGHLKRQLPGPREINGNLVRITHDYIYSVNVSSATMNSNGEIWRWRAR